MSRQISKNRWVNGKRRLCWEANPSEFAGERECGTPIVLGRFVLKENGVQVDTQDCYNGYEKAEVIRCFLANGTMEDTDV